MVDVTTRLFGAEAGLLWDFFDTCHEWGFPSTGLLEQARGYGILMPMITAAAIRTATTAYSMAPEFLRIFLIREIISILK
jgi:hypothetical protein